MSASKAPDVIVLGGGALGLAISYELLKNGARVTSVFPRSGDEDSASRAAGAMLGAFGEITADDGEAERAEFEFRLAAQRMYPRWLDEVRDRSGKAVQQGRGTFIVANNGGVHDRASARRIKAEADRYGEPAEWTEPEDVPGLKPSPPHAPHLCLHLGNEHSVDSRDLLDALGTCVSTFDAWTHVDDGVATVRQEGGRGLS